MCAIIDVFDNLCHTWVGEESIYPREKLDSLPILSDPKKRNVFTALIFLIPGTPKDLVTYIVGLTNMSIPLYLLLSTFARLPSIIISTIGGNALGNNRFVRALIAFIVSAVVSLIGYLIYNRISQKHKKKHSNEEDCHSEQ